MGKIEGISIRNYGSLKDITLGKTLSHQKEKPLSNMTTIIGPSGNGKSTIADVFGFIADCLEMGIEAACDAGNRGGFEQIRSQGIEDAIRFELYYRESSNTRPITYELAMDLDRSGRPYVAEELRAWDVQGHSCTFRMEPAMLLREIREDRMMRQAYQME